MGSSNRWLVDVNVTDQDTVNKIIEKGRQIDKGNEHWDSYVFRKWCESTKWDPTDLLVLISKEFPTVIFSANYRGDYGSGKIFIFNGEQIEEYEVWAHPSFPTTVKLKVALKNKKVRDKIQRERNEKRAAEEREASRRREIEATEKKLRELKRVK